MWVEWAETHGDFALFKRVIDRRLRGSERLNMKVANVAVSGQTKGSNA